MAPLVKSTLGKSVETTLVVNGKPAVDESMVFFWLLVFFFFL